MVVIKCLEWDPPVEWANKKKGFTVQPPPTEVLPRWRPIPFLNFLQGWASLA
jgi:hypothetical protein